MDFRTTTVTALAQRVRAGEVSARELTDAALERIDELDGIYNAFVAVDAAAARAQAERVDGRITDGEAPPLAGIPIGVKDLEDAAGYATTLGSLLHADEPAASEDSVLVSRLRAAGCVVVGKTNTPELGVKAQTSNTLFGATTNPWDPDRTPGGSSGGTAAALAAGMVPMATGSDGGGSIRIPAAMCGFTGFKPSLGRVPSGGPEPPGWPDQSTKAPMARRVRDAALALDNVVGPHPTDPRSLPAPSASWRQGLEDLHPPGRVAWSPTLGYAPLDDEVRAVCEAAVKRLGDEGTTVTEVDEVFGEDPVTMWLTVTGAANDKRVRHLRGTDTWDDLDPMLRFSADIAAESSAADVMAAEADIHRANFALVELLGDHRLLVCPTVASPVPCVDADGLINGEADPNWVRFTYPFNLTRSPAGSVCAGFTADGLPVGLQVVGPQHADAAVLRCLAVLEDLIGLETAPVG